VNLADAIGKRGEATVQRQLLSFFGGARPLFAPTFLGDKFPTFDLLVQLFEPPTSEAFFFAQVKTTRQGVRPRSRTLPTELDQARVASALRFRVPSYLLSVDDLAEMVYVTVIDRRLSGGVKAVPTAHPLNAANARRLWDEVELFWKGVRRQRARSHFSL
jgi:hypothetical protein